MAPSRRSCRFPFRARNRSSPRQEQTTYRRLKVGLRCDSANRASAAERFHHPFPQLPGRHRAPIPLAREEPSTSWPVRYRRSFAFFRPNPIPFHSDGMRPRRPIPQDEHCRLPRWEGSALRWLRFTDETPAVSWPPPGRRRIALKGQVMIFSGMNVVPPAGICITNPGVSGGPPLLDVPPLD